MSRLPVLFLTLCLCALALPALAKEPSWGRLITAPGPVAVRESPVDSAMQVRQLKAGQKVRLDFEEDGWAAVFDPAETQRSELRAQGYARLAELRAGTKGAAAAKPEAPGKPEAQAKTESKDAADKGQAAKKGKESQNFGEIRVPDRQLAVRAARDKDSNFMRLLQAGQRVRVDFHEDGWFAVFDPDEKVRDVKRAWGYARDKYLLPEQEYSGKPANQAQAKAETPAKESASKGKESAAKAEPPAKEPASKGKESAAKTEPPAKESAAKDAPGKSASAKPEPPAKESASKGKEVPAKPEPPAKDAKAKAGAADDAVGYAVLERHVDPQRPLGPVVLRVRLEVPAPPGQDALRRIARELWKAERKKGEDVQLEIFLPGMDKSGLAYAVARFHEDGRLREFWWRDVVLRRPGR